MRIDKSVLVGMFVAAVILAAGAAGAETFDKTVADALSKDGPALSQVVEQKRLATQPDAIEVQSERRVAGHPPHWHGWGAWRSGHHQHRSNYGWDWDAQNRPQWRGWAPWFRWAPPWDSCRGWYNGLHSQCPSECAVELRACLDTKDKADIVLCKSTGADCVKSCDDQWDTVWQPRLNACK